MLLALVLAAWVTPAAHEWVEISQTHYRKPPRTHAFPTITEDRHDLSINDKDRLKFTTSGNRQSFYPAHEEVNNESQRNSQHKTSEPTHSGEEDFKYVPERNVYTNHSVKEYNWKQNKYPSNIKSVKNGVKIKGNVTPEFSMEVFGEVTERDPELTTRNRPDQEVFSATIERVPNKGSVKRVQLSNSPVKSPAFTSTIRRNDIRKQDILNTDNDVSDEFEIKADIFKDSQIDVVAPVSNRKNIFTSTTETLIWKHDRTTTVWPITEPEMIFQKHLQASYENYETPANKVRNKVNISKIRDHTIEDDGYSAGSIASFEEKGVNKDSNMTIKRINEPENINYKKDIIHAGYNNNTDKNNKTKQNLKEQKNRATTNKNPNSNEKIRNENTMENVLNFLKIVTETISKNTRRDVNGKVKYLNELKDNLLCSIEERIESTWPDDSSTRGRRRRSAEQRGHVEFPSSESSLMTISFLTFAVFLIKLVLQVIQTYKHKAMMVAPLMVATAGRKLRKLTNFN